MYVFDDRNHKFNQTLLKLLGLWPYGKTKFQRLRAICFNALLLSFILVQLAQFTLVDFHFDVVIHILAEAFPAIIYFIKFNIFFYNAETVKQILEQITNNWRMLTDAREIKIAEYYAHLGRQITIFLMWFMMLALCGFLTMEMTPDILDLVLPLNESRLHYLPSVNEYHVYQENYFYFILLYCVINITIGVLTLVSVGSMFMLIILHCCAIFKISSYYIEHSVDEEIIALPNRKHLIIERIIKSVELHQNAQKLIETFMSGYTMFILVLILMGVTSLSLNLFRLLLAITYMDNLPELAAALVFVIGHELYLFAGNCGGQLIIDHSNELFNAIYKSLWYIAPVSVQRLLLFMMQCNVKDAKLNAGLFIASLEGFTTLSSMSMSYFTMIYSTQGFNK